MTVLRSLSRHVEDISYGIAHSELEEALKHHRNTGRRATIHGHKVDPFEYLVLVLNKFPELAFEYLDDGTDAGIPLFYLLRYRAPLEMVKEVFRMYPNPVKDGEDDEEGDIPLHPVLQAIYYECSVDVVSFLLETYPETSSKSLPMECLLDPCRGAARLHCDNYSAVFRLIYEKFPPQEWNDEGEWSRCINQLMQLRDICPALLAWLAQKEKDRYHGRCVFSLCGLHKKSIHVLQNLINFVPNLDCTTLELRGWSLDGEFLGRLLSEGLAPSSLTIKVKENLTDFRLPPFRIKTSYLEKWGSSELEQLSIQNFGGSSEDFNSLLGNFQVLPSLKKLSLGFTSLQAEEKDVCTDAVIDLLETGTLDWFELWGLRLEVDAKKLSQALQEPTHSEAFLHFSRKTFLGPDHNHDLAYHSAMNRHGRARLSSSNASRKVLVDCLSSATGSYDCFAANNLEESVLYGVLHLAPSLWATASAPLRKRLLRTPGPTCQKNAKRMK